MSLFSNLSGGRSRDDATAGHTAFRDEISAFGTRARNALRDGRDKAIGRFDPYAQYGQSGLDANRLYGDAVGVNGADARTAAFDTFESDPFLEYAQGNNALALRDVHRNMNAQGLVGSGANALAQNRVAGEFARRDIQDWLSRLQGFGDRATQVGYGATGQQAGYDFATGQGLSQIEQDIGNARAHSHLQNALYNAGTRSAGINNLMKIAGSGTNAFANVYKEL